MADLKIIVEQKVEAIKGQLDSRSYRVANELRNASQIVLRGVRSGNQYGGHIASKPGEPPAVQSGAFRSSWQPSTERAGNVYIAKIESGIHYAGYLEHGTSKMEARPYTDPIAQKATPKAEAIYKEPYF